MRSDRTSRARAYPAVATLLTWLPLIPISQARDRAQQLRGAAEAAALEFSGGGAAGEDEERTPEQASEL